MKKKVVLFLTGTRADFGKLKSLMNIVDQSELFDSHIFVTGMHMLARYGMTAREVEKSKFSSIYKYINQNSNDSMDVILAKTIHGLSDYVKEIAPDLIVVHGDRVEAMAGAIVGALNNILVSHIEGGEVSGTIDDLIRHSVSKLSHLHFVSNKEAKQRLVQLGEIEKSIFEIGSPDLDIMTSNNLPSITDVKKRYNIVFESYSIFMYHPVTTDVKNLSIKIKQTVDALLSSNSKYIVIFPNNDHGSDIIINELARLKDNPNFRVYPSIRFEYFLTLLKNTNYIIGNSSAGVREAPFYGIPTINLGSRQNNRAMSDSIINCEEIPDEIIKAINIAKKNIYSPTKEFGNGESYKVFYNILLSNELWETAKQKTFVDYT